eukprot:CAMPEP_0202980458 /NCGR_PEP_ID=MMETSP1396-20130829/86383_1 /ASSEMBLY_ACC=CAM_ASM_000872 /TAXON_ID= /ORGANISM="Pseudokeronopsis sp., Strain Brazil" /LENGTH=68 /DNA_ID=CAMNT_0049720457 /DNA_START=764 /DNA_END=970 /DNA_ORIENTATION=+
MSPYPTVNTVIITSHNAFIYVENLPEFSSQSTGNFLSAKYIMYPHVNSNAPIAKAIACSGLSFNQVFM